MNRTLPFKVKCTLCGHDREVVHDAPGHVAMVCERCDRPGPAKAAA